MQVQQGPSTRERAPSYDESTSAYWNSPIRGIAPGRTLHARGVGIHRTAPRQRSQENYVIANRTAKPALGILCLDGDASYIGGVMHPESYDFEVICRTVPGMTFEICQSGVMPKSIETAFGNAVKHLAQDKRVSGITASCSLMVPFYLRTPRCLTSVC